MIKWSRTSRLSINNSLWAGCGGAPDGPTVGPYRVRFLISEVPLWAGCGCTPEEGAGGQGAVGGLDACGGAAAVCQSAAGGVVLEVKLSLLE